MRTLSGMMLAATVGLLAGCGGANPTPDTQPTTPLAPTTAAPVAPNDKVPSTPPVPPPLPAATVGWEMDPGKQGIPNAPVEGKVGGEAFKPDVSVYDHTISFRVQQEGKGARVVEVVLPAGGLQTANAVKFSTRPDAKDGPETPRILLEIEPAGAKPDAVKRTAYPNGYALTLELKKDKNRVSGRISLSLPDDAKSYLAGEFTATRTRPPDSPPGPDDSPFVQGKLTVAGAENPVVQTGYVGLPPNSDFIQGEVELPFAAKNQSVLSEPAIGRVSTLSAPTDALPHGRYEHTRLVPARYLVFARVLGGPAAWQWITVTPDGQHTADFALDASKSGGLEVTVPAGYAGDVRLAPADDPEKPLDFGLVLATSVILKLEAKPKDGKAAFAKLGPGKYEVRGGDAGELMAVVEVKAGETAKVELKKK